MRTRFSAMRTRAALAQPFCDAFVSNDASGFGRAVFSSNAGVNAGVNHVRSKPEARIDRLCSVRVRVIV
jgi:hypothetical protein